MKHTLLLACLALSCTTAANAAGTLRCQGKIIREGVPAVYVLATCGPPVNQLIQEVPARAGTASGFSRLAGIAVSEQWVYDRGPGRFPAVLAFVDGTLRRIDFLPHRSVEPGPEAEPGDRPSDEAEATELRL